MSRPGGPFVLLAGSGAAPELYAHPRTVLRADHPHEVETVLAAADGALAAGHTLAGYAAYELGYALEAKLAPLMPPWRDGPLFWFGVFDDPAPAQAAAALLDGPAADLAAPPRPRWTQAEYSHAFAAVQGLIRAGDIYQANLTFPLDLGAVPDGLALFRALRPRANAAHAAMIHDGTRDILSLSPELFARWQGRAIEMRPMKGTAPRGATPALDRTQAEALAADPKQRAENLMIVDLIRNDLSRIAETGSVRVSDLFSVETYPTLHQMTSGVTARLRPESGFAAILRAMFPCGSVTGAPKIRAMEVLRELEPWPRGVYCGILGVIGPQGGTLSVAIRTLTIADGAGVMGVGSGLVYDSDGAEEWRECLLKAKFLGGDG